MELNFNTTVWHVDHDKHLTKTELLRLALDRTRKRLQWLQQAARPNINVGAPIRYSGDGAYLAYLSIGTPGVSVPAILDTGGGLTWTQCASCHNCSAQPTPLFNPSKSTSYVALKCPNKKCKLYTPNVCDKRACGTECAFNLTYGDGSGTGGNLATETFWFEADTVPVPVPGVLFGCGFHTQGNMPNGGVGNLGLGRWNDSIVSQLDERVFSYCLPLFGSKKKTGRLFMGSGAAAPHGALTTQLLRYPGSYYGGFYYLQLQGISINGVPVTINSSAFQVGKDGSGGLIIDSGTTITNLDNSTFEAVGQELTSQMAQIGLPWTNSSSSDLEFCYKLPRGKMEAGIQFPKIVFEFKGAALELPWQKYFFVVEKGIGCLMMAATDMDFSILGNFQQQNTLVIYDLGNEKLSFVPNTKCGN
ncbi:eukaryotic aspartyl protease family protein [Striga asiatica]|uniref:Eukaryotic aspartyl protease family protein n=1 Tax=Striga asiatica TaxID=4170 RepID=A0A5A7Q531_STRAF|nr:eukaryotic aspartyl protease family protein [Striga asiatica]